VNARPHKLHDGQPSRGTARAAVALIGCGPGDPELLTLKAVKRIAAADVLVVDRLVNPAVLAHARAGVARIDVGKEGYGAATPQEEINRILVREALAGRRVARLKGGDPFVFGRAAEELAALQWAGIEVEVIPGITAAHGCAAAIGLPLTLRRHVQSFSILTGAAAEAEPDLDWTTLARPGHAFAIYMGVRKAPVLRDHLLAAGADPAAPVVIVEKGTLPNERTLATTLGLLPEAIAARGLHGPAIIFVGLDWSAGGLERPASVETFPAGSSIGVLNQRPVITVASCRAAAPVS
jgi:uroporphyrin-III C-methyltransferase/precorrin-2 dehydrogenase/sirohydrochlorin ferrochelatase